MSEQARGIDFPRVQQGRFNLVAQGDAIGSRLEPAYLGQSRPGITQGQLGNFRRDIRRSRFGFVFQGRHQISGDGFFQGGGVALLEVSEGFARGAEIFLEHGQEQGCQSRRLCEPRVGERAGRLAQQIHRVLWEIQGD